MDREKTDIILGNLLRLGEERAELFEKYIAHLGELSDMLCDEADEEEIFFKDRAFAAAYSELAEAVCDPRIDAAAPFNIESVTSSADTVSGYFRAFICKKLTDSLGIKGIQATGTYFDELEADDDETVSYMRNSYADEAYARFSGRMSEPKVIYGHDFAEVCENVYYEKSKYCILPVENSTDGRLAGFRRLIIKYGLKTVMITRVETAEGEATVFALLKKNISVPRGEGQKYIELRIDSGERLPTLISASEVFKMKLTGITSVPEYKNTYDAVFSVDEDGICGFLSFLFLEYRDFTVTGFFGEI